MKEGRKLTNEDTNKRPKQYFQMDEWIESTHTIKYKNKTSSFHKLNFF